MIRSAILASGVLTMASGWSGSARACDTNALRVLVPTGIESLDVSRASALFGAAGYHGFAPVRIAAPMPELQITCGRLSYTQGVLRYLFPSTASGPSGARAQAGGGSVFPVELGYVVLQRGGWEVAPFGGVALGLSYLTVKAPAGTPALPAGIYASQGRVDFPMRVGMRFTRTFDTVGDTLFGYAERGKQGAGPALSLELGFVATPGAPWYEDSGGIGSGPRSDVPGLGSFGPFVRIAIGYGAWHAGGGPWR